MNEENRDNRGGFAGLAAAKALKHADADVVVIDRANHNLFQPLGIVGHTAMPPRPRSATDGQANFYINNCGG
jgi:hypothetical protein